MIQNARAEGVTNLPRRFWPDALRHFCRLYAYWPDANGLSVWGKLDHLQPHELLHNLVKDLHVFGSYVTGHLPRAHPHVADTTHDDRAEGGVFLGNDLTTPRIALTDLTDADIRAMHAADGHEDGDVPVDVVTTRSGCL
jgi:hypothetical protein